MVTGTWEEGPCLPGRLVCSSMYSTKSQVATVEENNTCTQRNRLGGSSFPSSSRVGSFAWTDQGRFILSVLVLGDPQRVLGRVPCGSWSDFRASANADTRLWVGGVALSLHLLEVHRKLQVEWDAGKRKEGQEEVKGGLGLR